MYTVTACAWEVLTSQTIARQAVPAARILPMFADLRVEFIAVSSLCRSFRRRSVIQAQSGRKNWHGEGRNSASGIGSVGVAENPARLIGWA
jgi:hypothetical protein